MADEPSYFVVLKDSDGFDLARLAGVLSVSLGMHRLDAASQLKRSWGLLHKTPVLEEARALQRDCEGAGIETFVLPESKLKKVPEPKVLKKGVPKPEGLVYGEEGAGKLLPWHSVVLLCAGEVEETMRVKEILPPEGKVKKWLMRTGLSVTSAVAIAYERSKTREVTKQKTGSAHYLDMVAKDGFESVRIVGDSFDYSYLGDKMAYNALINFKAFILDVCRFLPGVTRNRGMRAMDLKDVTRDSKYQDYNDYEKEKLWLMQL